jgi:hypothetical protein
MLDHFNVAFNLDFVIVADFMDFNKVIFNL